MLQRPEDGDLALKVAQVLSGGVLQLLDGHHLPGAVLQWVIAAHLHTAKVALQKKHGGETQSGRGQADLWLCVTLTFPSCLTKMRCRSSNWPVSRRSAPQGKGTEPLGLLGTMSLSTSSS